MLPSLEPGDDMRDDLQDFPVSSLFRGIEGPRSPERNAAQDLANAKNGLRILGYTYRETYPEEQGEYHDSASDRARSAPPPSKPARWFGGIPIETGKDKS